MSRPETAESGVRPREAGDGAGFAADPLLIVQTTRADRLLGALMAAGQEVRAPGDRATAGHYKRSRDKRLRPDPP